jgi:hypothetical protein
MNDPLLENHKGFVLLQTRHTNCTDTRWDNAEGYETVDPLKLEALERSTVGD